MRNAIYSAYRFKLSETAQRSMQQRGIPRLAVEYLLRYGKAVPDGQGNTILHFDQAAIERLVSDEGRAALRPMQRAFDTYLVQDRHGLVTAVDRYDRMALHRQKAA